MAQFWIASSPQPVGVTGVNALFAPRNDEIQKIVLAALSCVRAMPTTTTPLSKNEFAPGE